MFVLQYLQEQMEKDEVKLCTKTLTGNDTSRAEFKKKNADFQFCSRNRASYIAGITILNGIGI